MARLRSPVRATIAILGLLALGVLAGCAAFFDSTTLLFVGAAMLVVSFFASAAVVLGVWTRRAAEGRTRSDDAEVISDDPRR